jgi:hypothetical protein
MVGCFDFVVRELFVELHRRGQQGTRELRAVFNSCYLHVRNRALELNRVREIVRMLLL